MVWSANNNTVFSVVVDDDKARTEPKVKDDSEICDNSPPSWLSHIVI